MGENINKESGWLSLLLENANVTSLIGTITFKNQEWLERKIRKFETNQKECSEQDNEGTPVIDIAR